MTKEEAAAVVLANEPEANKKKILGSAANLLNKGATSIGNLGSNIENLGKNTNIVAMNASLKYRNFIDAKSTNVVTGIDNFSTDVTGVLDKLSAQIKLNLQPFSEFTGSTLGTLTGVLQDPLGPNGLGNVATRLINQVSPGMGDKINGLNQSLNLQALSRFPSQVVSGIDHILTGLGNLLAVPLNILSEIYYGYQAIMQSISKMISSVMKSVTQLLFDFLDSLIPIKSILGLLEQVSTLANQVGGIAGAFNISAITDVTNQITGFTDQFTSVLENPLDFAASFLPPQVSDILNDLQDPQSLIEGLLPEQAAVFVDGLKNPQNLIKSFLPPDMAAGFDKISEMTGFGYQGNAGWGFRKAMDGTQTTVLTNIMSQFKNQTGAFGPVLAGRPDTPEGYQPKFIDGKYDVMGYNSAKRETKNQYKKEGDKEGVTAYARRNQS